MPFSVYDWKKNQRINRFANGSPASVPISSVRFVNEDDVALLMTGSCASPPHHSPSTLTDEFHSRRSRPPLPQVRVAVRRSARLIVPRHLRDAPDEYAEAGCRARARVAARPRAAPHGRQRQVHPRLGRHKGDCSPGAWFPRYSSRFIAAYL